MRCIALLQQEERRKAACLVPYTCKPPLPHLKEEVELLEDWRIAWKACMAGHAKSMHDLVGDHGSSYGAGATQQRQASGPRPHRTTAQQAIESKVLRLVS